VVWWVLVLFDVLLVLRANVRPHHLRVRKGKPYAM